MNQEPFCVKSTKSGSKPTRNQSPSRRVCSSRASTVSHAPLSAHANKLWSSINPVLTFDKKLGGGVGGSSGGILLPPVSWSLISASLMCLPSLPSLALSSSALGLNIISASGRTRTQKVRYVIATIRTG